MVRSCVIAIVVGSLSACSANPPSEEIPTPLGWDEASGRLQAALEESRSMGSNWVIDVEDALAESAYLCGAAVEVRRS